MKRTDEYRARLRSLENWDPYLLAESGLPGPRANLELAQAAAEEGEEALFLRYVSAYPDTAAPANSPEEFLAFCGIAGLGRLAAGGQRVHLPLLRLHASDPRWRIREAVALAMQRLGEADMGALIVELESWSQGNPLEQRAAAAAICEPALLRQPEHAQAALRILDCITASIEAMDDRRSGAFLALRKGLGYCWSVAAAALPKAGKPAMEKWMQSGDRDILWIMRENLKKNRLVKLDETWVARWSARLGRWPEPFLRP